MSEFATQSAAELGEQLQLFARYLDVIGKQLEALSTGDTDRVDELEEERTSVESSLHDEKDDPAELGDVEELLALGLAALRENTDGARQLEERWSHLSTGALRSARKVRAPRLRTGSYSLPGFTDSHFDRRL